jgi:uncharacterized protein YjbI with pentapeptide repeats
MEKFENSFKLPEQEKGKPEKLTAEDVKNRIEKGEDLEKLDLADLDLAGLNLENKNFRGSDIRGIILCCEDKKEDGEIFEVTTNIKGADFTDATISDLGETYFNKVDAEGAVFGYTEDLISRRKRHKESGEQPKPKDSGGLFSFIGDGGNFKRTEWANADFGGNSGYEASFFGADFTEATIKGCDLSGMDFSETDIDNIKIIDPVSLRKMRINENQIDSVVEAIQLSNEEKQAEFLKEKEDKGSRKALEDFFQVVVAGSLP